MVPWCFFFFFNDLGCIWLLLESIFQDPFLRFVVVAVQTLAVKLKLKLNTCKASFIWFLIGEVTCLPPDFQGFFFNSV